MGSTNNIKETNISLQLEGKECQRCDKEFKKIDLDNGNYEIYFDTTNDVKLIEMKKIEEKMNRIDLAKFNDNYWDMLYYPFGRSGYQFSIWIRSIEHKDCEETAWLEKQEEKKQLEGHVKG